MYKMIAIDLDGTLLNSYSEVTMENINALKYAKNKGIEIVLASGRIANSVANIANEIETNNYYISGNGSMLYDMQNSKILYENYINKEKMLELIKLCEENSIYYNIYTEDTVIAKSINYNVLFYNYENSKKSQERKTKLIIPDNVYTYIKESNIKKFLKMTICDENKIIFSGISKMMKKINEIDVLDVSHMSRKMIKSGTETIEIGYYYTEITKRNVDKWYAIEELMKIKGIKKEEVIAIGDNLNDKIMIENAGLGIAMGHSNPEVKKVADFVTKSNNENGVALAIQKFI